MADPVNSLLSGVERSLLPLFDTSTDIGRAYVDGLHNDIALLRRALAELSALERQALTLLDVATLTSDDLHRYVRLYVDITY
jgi:hypothetical protein